jgi:hypothetical protein
LRRAWPAVVLAAVYFVCATPWVLGGDDGEFATLFAEGGMAHPPGYAAYTVWLRLWSWLPGTPAHGAALATALLAVAAAVVLYRAARAWGASAGASLCAVGVYALSPLALRYATQSEVFAGHALLCASVVRLAAPAPMRWRAPLVGLVFGLGAMNHHTLVLAAPLGLLALFREERRGRAFGLAAAGFVVGLLPAIYLVWVSSHRGDRWVWGDASTVAELIRHLRRADYGSLSLAAHGGGREPLAQGWALVKDVGLGLLIVPVVLALVALARLRPRRDAIAWWITLILAGPVILALFNLPPRGLALHIVERFHLMLEVLLVVPMALGLDAIAQRIPRGRVAVAVAAALVVLAGARSLPMILDEHRPTVDRWARDTLAALPPDSVVLMTGDHRTFGLLYAQRALGLRPDVVCISPRLLFYDWYRARAAAGLHRALPAPVNGSVDTRALAQTVLDAGRPLFLTDVFSPAIPASFTTFPIGPVIRVLPSGSAAPSLEQLEAMNLQRVKDLPLLDEPAPARDTFAALVRADYARPFVMLSQAPGDPARAARNRARAAAIAP